MLPKGEGKVVAIVVCMGRGDEVAMATVAVPSECLVAHPGKYLKGRPPKNNRGWDTEEGSAKPPL